MDLLYRFDMEGFRAVDVGLRSTWLDPVFLVLSYSGLGQVQFVAALCLSFWKSARAYVVPLLVAILIGGVVGAQGIKHLVERQRPSVLSFAHPEEKIFSNSFPSGHTTTSFACAFLLVFLTWRTKRWWWGWLAILWALLVGASRVYRGVHWPTDVLGGVFCGLAAASITYLLVGGWRARDGAAVGK